MKKQLLAALIIFQIFLVGTPEAGDEMTVEEAIQIALENNYDIKIARYDVEIAQNNRAYGRAGFLPTVGLSGSAQHLRADTAPDDAAILGDTDTGTMSVRIALSWTLFDGLKMFAEKQRYDELAKLGEFHTRYAIENQIVATAEAFFDVVQQEQLVDIARRTLDVSKARLNKEQVRHDVGGASSTDLLNAQVAYNNDRSTLLDQELQLVVTRQNLNVLLGRSTDTPIRVDATIREPHLKYDLQELLHMARDKNSQLQAALSNRKISVLNQQTARSAVLPQIDLTTSYSYTDQTISGDNLAADLESERRDAFVGVAVSYNLFNGFRDRTAIANARIEARRADLALQDRQNRIEAAVRQQYETLTQQLELIDLNAQNVAAAERNLQLQQDRYEIGATTSLEFRDAQVSLARTQTSLIEARYQAQTSFLRLQQVSGLLSIDE